MKLRRIGAVQLAERLIGVVPTAVFVGPSLLILIAGPVVETIPGTLVGLRYLRSLPIMLGWDASKTPKS